METRRWSELKKRKLSPEQSVASEEWAKGEALAMTLRELREFAQKTQEDVAETAAMTQSELSRLERRDDHLLSTLRRYVEALGGRLEVVAVFENRQIKLENV
jgi:transcriptional regulator with XRE-family HTH domain